MDTSTAHTNAAYLPEPQDDAHGHVYRCRADYWMREWPFTVQGLAQAAGKHPAEVANELAASSRDDEAAPADDLISRYTASLTINH